MAASTIPARYHYAPYGESLPRPTRLDSQIEGIVGVELAPPGPGKARGGLRLQFSIPDHEVWVEKNADGIEARERESAGGQLGSSRLNQAPFVKSSGKSPVS